MFGYCILCHISKYSVSFVRDAEWILPCFLDLAVVHTLTSTHSHWHSPHPGGAVVVSTQLPSAPPTHTLTLPPPFLTHPQGNNGCSSHSSSSSLGHYCSLLPRAQEFKLSICRGASLETMFENSLEAWSLWPVGTALWHSCFQSTCMFF